MSGHFPTRIVTTEADISQDVGTFSTRVSGVKAEYFWRDSRTFTTSCQWIFLLRRPVSGSSYSDVLSVDLLTQTSCQWPQNQVVLTRCQDISQFCLMSEALMFSNPHWAVCCGETEAEDNHSVLTQNSWNTLWTLCWSGWCWSEQVKCVLDPQRSGIKEAPRVLSAVSDISASRRHETSDFSCR